VIVEGLLTTINADGSVNLAPMGPKWDPAGEQLLLRPYQTSTSFANLVRSRRGIFHITDDVELLARAAIARIAPPPPMTPLGPDLGWVLDDCCRWHAFRVDAIDDRQPRAEISVTIVDSGRRRDFLGFNRARHAVLEAAILATRVHLLPADEILAEFDRLLVPVQKTGDPPEARALEMLRQHVLAAIGRPLGAASH
jgi:hypothetical protein